MGATSPEQIDELMLAAYKSKDAEAIADLYEDDAIFSNPPEPVVETTALSKRFGPVACVPFQA